MDAVTRLERVLAEAVDAAASGAPPRLGAAIHHAVFPRGARKDKDGKFMWPGFSENMRILKWIVDRARGEGRAKETPIGWMPRYEDIDWKGLDFPKENFEELQSVERAAWRAEVLSHEELFLDIHAHLPKEMMFERELLICRLL